MKHRLGKYMVLLAGMIFCLHFVVPHHHHDAYAETVTVHAHGEHHHHHMPHAADHFSQADVQKATVKFHAFDQPCAVPPTFGDDAVDCGVPVQFTDFSPPLPARGRHIVRNRGSPLV